MARPCHIERYVARRRVRSRPTNATDCASSGRRAHFAHEYEMPPKHTMAIGRTAARLPSSLVHITRKGEGAHRRSMRATVRLRPRRASSVISVSRLANRRKRSSLSIADLQLSDGGHRVVEDPLQLVTIDPSAELRDESGEAVQPRVYR